MSEVKSDGPSASSDNKHEENSICLATCSDNDEDEDTESLESEEEEDSAAMATSSPAIQVRDCSEVQIGTRYQYNAPTPGVSAPDTAAAPAVLVRDSSGVHIGNQYVFNQVMQVNGPELYGVVPQPGLEAAASRLDQLSITSSSQDTADKPTGGTRVIDRKEWLAPHPTPPPQKLQHPLNYVIILHTATENCSEEERCFSAVRRIRNYHITEHGWWDIGYHFLVGGDCNVYEGRGWDISGSFCRGYNDKAIGIAFLGTFCKTVPSQEQIQVGFELIAHGVELGKISPDYKLLAHRQLRPTESPGAAFYEVIKTWPHWSEYP